MRPPAERGNRSTSGKNRGRLEPMSRPTIVFAHGAGVPSASAWMQTWRRRLEALGDVTLFDYPYMRQKKRRPDPQPVLEQAHREVIAQLTSNAPLVLAGKSMGSRIGCHV